MLIAVINAREYHHARQQINLALSQADGIELRLDYWNILDIKKILLLKQEFNIPMIFTLRKKSQGGFYGHTETQRLVDILKVCELQPEYIDLEYDVPADFIEKLHKKYPHIKLLSSYHDFVKTPDDFSEILLSMQNKYFAIYKIAVRSNSIIDSLKLLKFTKDFSREYPLATMSMGESSSCTRILGPILGSQICYASLSESEKTAPGQLSLDNLNNIYHIRKLNLTSKIYALLGDPVSASAGDILHNKAIKILNKNAVYIKLQAKPHELKEVIQYCRDLPFGGFSITMPLKEKIIDLLDNIDELSMPIKSINSIIINNINSQNKYTGFNTDGIGAIKVILDHIKKLDLKNRTILILGAGGAARAIAFEAIKQGAKIIIINRSLDKAKVFSEDLGCEFVDIANKTQIQSIDYHVIINTLPAGILPPDNLIFIPEAIAMDIVYIPIHTVFLKLAKKSGCIIIPGYKMYINQALLQIVRWFKPDQKQMDVIKNYMENYFSGSCRSKQFSDNNKN